MAAGVHLASVLRGIVEAGDLGQRQRVHIGTKANGRAIPLPLDDRHHARGGDAGVDLGDAKLLEPLDHIRRCLFAMHPQFGIAVDVLAPRFHVVGIGGNSVDDGHGWTLGLG